MVGFQLRLRAAASVQTVQNQSIDYGGLTIASAGGAKALSNAGAEVSFVSVDNQGGATRTWSVSSGRLIASGTPGVDNGIQLLCTTALGQITVTIVSSGTDANGNNLSVGRSVSNVDELKSAVAAATLAYNDCILLRTGDYGDAATDNRARPATNCPVGTFTAPTDFSETVVVEGVTHHYRGPDMSTGNYVKVVPHNGALPVIVRVTIDGLNSTKGGFLFKGLTFTSTSGVDIDGNTSCMITLLNDINNVAFYQSSFNSTVSTTGYNCRTGIITSTGAAFPGFKLIDCTFNNCWNAIISGDAMDNGDIIGNTMTNCWNDFVKVVGGNDFRVCWNTGYNKKVANKTAAVTGITRGATTVIGLTPGFIAANGVMANDDITFYGIVGTTQLNGGPYNITSVNSGADTITISVNSSGYGAYVSGGTAIWVEAHGDFLQVRTAGDTFDNIFIAGNLFYRGLGSEYLVDGQGIFAPTDGVSPDVVTNFVSIFNMYMGSMARGSSHTVTSGAVVRGNTIIYDRTLGQADAVTIFFDNGDDTIVEDNIVCAAINLTSNPVISNTNNLVISPVLTTGPTSYEEVFVAPANGAAVTDFPVQFAISPTGDAWSMSPKGGAAGTGYVNYSTRTITAPHLA